MDAKAKTRWPKNAPPPAEAPFDAAQARAHQDTNLTAEQLLNRSQIATQANFLGIRRYWFPRHKKTSADITCQRRLPSGGEGN
jgi:hypothetical protein